MEVLQVMLYVGVTHMFCIMGQFISIKHKSENLFYIIEQKKLMYLSFHANV